VVLLGVAVAGAGGPHGAGPPAGQTRAVLKTTAIGGTTVLINGQGFTLYWFAPDTPAWSACKGACAQYWPPVTGRPAAGPGVTGRLGAITRSDGSTQATYGGHPLYTYVADIGPGPGPGQWQQPQPERWPVARSHRDQISPRQNTVATPALTPDGGSSSACP